MYTCIYAKWSKSFSILNIYIYIELKNDSFSFLVFFFFFFENSKNRREKCPRYIYLLAPNSKAPRCTLRLVINRFKSILRYDLFTLSFNCGTCRLSKKKDPRHLKKKKTIAMYKCRTAILKIKGGIVR